MPTDPLPAELPRRYQWLSYDENDPTVMLDQINQALQQIDLTDHTDFRAPRPLEPNTNGQKPGQQFHEAMQMAHEMQFEQAKHILRAIKDLDFKEWGQECNEWLARLNSYEAVVSLADSPYTLDRARERWRKHRRQHGADFDPYDIEGRIQEQLSHTRSHIHIRKRPLLPVAAGVMLFALILISIFIFVLSGNEKSESEVLDNTTDAARVMDNNLTDELPTSTPEPPTATDEPPTSTPEPPTATDELPTSTLEPPTATDEPPTSTPEPSTATDEPPAATNESTSQSKGQRMIINFAEVNSAGGASRQTVDVYFTIVDDQNCVVPDADPDNAHITTAEGIFDAEVLPATAPIYLVIAIDLSGSMGPVMTDIRNAAIVAVVNAPEETQIALVTFNENIRIVQTFTNDRNLIINEIGAMQSTLNAGTCLYDTSMHSMQLLDDNAGGVSRRAVLLFTDGRDEVLGGDPCSVSTFDEVQQRARRVGQEVAFYTIGMSGGQAIDENMLNNLATRTGGLSVFGTQDELGALFREAMEALSSQWVARSNICVASTVNTITLQVSLGSHALEPQARSVNIDNDCIPATIEETLTPVYPVISIISIEYNSETDQLTLALDIQQIQEIPEFSIQLIDTETQRSVASFAPKPAEFLVLSLYGCEA